MRTYDQLKAAALATGTYANYQGDGYSVPWQVALPTMLPVGMTMALYKIYLDLHWPEGARLHDWTYTPYSIEIDCQRDEADHALYEYLLRYSPLDALIVYTAVRTAGDPYWQRSMTGYTGRQYTLNLPNMPLVLHDC